MFNTLGTTDNAIVAYFNVFKILFTLRASASAVAPSGPIDSSLYLLLASHSVYNSPKLLLAVLVNVCICTVFNYVLCTRKYSILYSCIILNWQTHCLNWQLHCLNWQLFMLVLNGACLSVVQRLSQHHTSPMFSSLTSPQVL